MTPALPALRPSLVHLSIFGGWLLFTLMVIAISWTGALLRGQNPAFGANLLWNLGWLLWAGATFLVAHLTRRFPLRRRRLAGDIVRHVGLGIGVSVALLLCEFVFAHALRSIWPRAPQPNALLGFIVYKLHVYFLIYWMIVGATRAFDYHTKYRATELLAAQLESRLAAAQLLALKTQLQPHFLFNTHHAIVSRMVRQDNAAAIRMLTQLSDLLRLTLREPDKQLIPLRDELEALRLYLAIQRERYGDRLAVSLDVDPATLDAEIPWLLLQPLVENALQHGIDTLAEGGELLVQIGRVGGEISMRIRDNGPGFPANFALVPGGPGIGLRNTEARLARLYGDQFSLRFAGSEVRVTWPFRAAASP